MNRNILSITGMLGEKEVELLYNRALETIYPIVEIGSFRGLSTVALASGSKAGHNVLMYAIDPHDPGNEAYPFGPEDRAALLKNLVDYGVADIVRILDYQAGPISYVLKYGMPIGLLWIDGDHSQAESDFNDWIQMVIKGGYILMHDRHLEQVQRCANYPFVERLPDVGGILQLRRL